MTLLHHRHAAEAAEMNVAQALARAAPNAERARALVVAQQGAAAEELAACSAAAVALAAESEWRHAQAAAVFPLPVLPARDLRS
jgi:predicted DCC family thiol-disulfide oxidoreductase YuxK